MRPGWPTLVLMLVLAAVPAAAAEPPSLARARALYNAADFDGAISAAAVARQIPDAADAASLVLARAHLERYRRNANADDLTAARTALAGVHADVLTPRDRVDLLVGLGQSLFFGEVFGAAGELFDTALGSGNLLPARDRLMLLDWWASALDREAQLREAERRAPLFARILDRMEQELRADPGSHPANYWLAVAARGMGDIDRAWNAAVAGWVRAPLAADTAAALRADLDRLVTQVLVPERVRPRPAAEQEAATATVRAEWDLVKGQWP
ncbi:MAG: hypothetical protein AB7K63_13520 [Vicinamibacterales bacterium]